MTLNATGSAMDTLDQSTRYSLLTQVAISPNQQHIVSVGSEGAIFVWKLPQEVINTCKQASMAIH